jgi:protein-disulfide isomerase
MNMPNIQWSNKERMMRTFLLLLPALMLSGQTAPAPKAPVKAVAAKAPAPETNYKEQGSPSAPITIEAYTDYECPHCGRFYREFMPQFKKDYIDTGKVRFVHRDFPLVQIGHIHAMLAARYADAAGEIGFYDLAVNQIFQTQDSWYMYGKNTGDIDGVLSQVLPPGAMQKVRELVKNDPRIDASITKDVNMANNVDHVNSTPTIVIVTKNGKREPDASVMEVPYPIFKKYLDAKIAGQ